MTQTDFDSSKMGHGKKVNISQVREFLEVNAKINSVAEAKGLQKTVSCIWGPPGCGKTSLVKQMAMLDGKENYEVIDVPIAQFEEMGDFHGLPHETEDGRTTMLTPEWVPTEEKQGILLFDDFNRASVRIIKGIMQLLQDYKTIYWDLPAGWNIILTGNPDTEEWLVTSLDSAILTRMKHITLLPDAKAWAEWAEASNIDGRCINFMLAYPELIYTGTRTNPRSWTQFFEYFSVEGIDDDNEEMIALQGEATVDPEPLAAFIQFLSAETDLYIEPMEILTNYAPYHDKVSKYATNNRMDVIGVMAERVKNTILSEEFKKAKKVKGMAKIYADNFRAFLKTMHMPKDLSYMIIQEIVSKSPHNVDLLIKDKELAAIVKEVAV